MCALANASAFPSALPLAQRAFLRLCATRTRPHDASVGMFRPTLALDAATPVPLRALISCRRHCCRSKDPLSRESQCSLARRTPARPVSLSRREQARSRPPRRELLNVRICCPQFDVHIICVFRRGNRVRARLRTPRSLRAGRAPCRARPRIALFTPFKSHLDAARVGTHKLY